MSFGMICSDHTAEVIVDTEQSFSYIVDHTEAKYVSEVERV